MLQRVLEAIATLLGPFLAAMTFYTSLPIPLPNQGKALDFTQVARLAPLVGCLLGAGLGLIDLGLASLGMPVLTRCTVVILAWIALTGGLHLDGAMDTADGLAVQDPDRRLQVMADSATGAFGAMVAIALVVLKIMALSELTIPRWLALILAAGWGRWAQQVAIARYPYLKPTGKGAMHKQAIRSGWDTLPSLLLLLLICGLIPWGVGLNLLLGMTLAILGGAIALAVPAWFNVQLGGHTGDTYGAVVEWSEALFLVGLTLLTNG